MQEVKLFTVVDDVIDHLALCRNGAYPVIDPGLQRLSDQMFPGECPCQIIREDRIGWVKGLIINFREQKEVQADSKRIIPFFVGK